MIRVFKLLFVLVLVLLGAPSLVKAELSMPKIYSPNSLAKDQAGNTYIAGLRESQIFKLSPDGVLTLFAGQGDEDYRDGLISEARFRNPYAVTVDSKGNVLVADSGNNAIRKINVQTGIVTTLAGSTKTGDSDGIATEAQFNFPVGLAVDEYDNLYVADQRNHMIRKVDKNGIVSTVAGNSEKFGDRDGVKTQALFRYPAAVQIGADQNLYIVDHGNNKLKMITASGSVRTILNEKDNRSKLRIPAPVAELERVAAL